MLDDDQVTISSQTITTIYDFAIGHRVYSLTLLAGNTDTAPTELCGIKSVQYFTLGRPDPPGRIIASQFIRCRRAYGIPPGEAESII